MDSGVMRAAKAPWVVLLGWSLMRTQDKLVLVEGYRTKIGVLGEILGRRTRRKRRREYDELVTYLHFLMILQMLEASLFNSCPWTRGVERKRKWELGRIFGCILQLKNTRVCWGNVGRVKWVLEWVKVEACAWKDGRSTWSSMEHKKACDGDEADNPRREREMLVGSWMEREREKREEMSEILKGRGGIRWW